MLMPAWISNHMPCEVWYEIIYLFQNFSWDAAVLHQSFNIWGSFYLHGLMLMPAWISNHMPCEVWYEIIYLFQNFHRMKFGNG